jgi:type II secretory pathway pseudopilin PulG
MVGLFTVVLSRSIVYLSDDHLPVQPGFPRKNIMLSQRGMTIIELVVLVLILTVLTSIAIPKFIEASIKNKMWDGMSTLMTYESAQLAYLAQSGAIGPVDSLVFKADSSLYFFFSEDGIGYFKATAKMKIGRFKAGSWLRTTIDTTGGMPRIKRSCSKNDSLIARKYIAHYFRK